MRIALVVPWLEVGGVETFVFRLAQCCQQLGHEVEIVATRQEGEWFGRARQLGIPTVCLSEQKSSSLAQHAIAVGNYLRLRRFDVCFLNHSREAQASIAMLPDQSIVIPIIHNDLDDVYAVGCANRGAWNVAVAVGHKVFLHTRKLIPGKAVVEIPYGVDLPPSEWVGSRRCPEVPLRAVFVGRLLHWQKAILFLPEIVASCLRKGIDLSLTIVGDGPDRQTLLDKSMSLNVGHRIEFKGALPLTETYAEMARAHLLLLPSFFEGLPIVLLEAMACGCVPIVSRLVGVTDFVVDDCRNGFLVEVGNIDGFVEAIGGVFSNRFNLRSLSLASRRTIEERFTVERMANAYLELIRRTKKGEFGTPSRSNLPRLDPELIPSAAHAPGKLARIFRYGRAALRRELRAFQKRCAKE